MASVDGVRSSTLRARERIVTDTSSTAGAHNIHTVWRDGSSIALSRALAASSVSRSASSMMRICQRPSAGRSAAERTYWRMSLTPIESPSVEISVMSGWLPARAVVHEWHSPQPPSSHCSAAAKARAALERPEPGGPVNSHACVIERPSPSADATADCNVSTTGSWPTRSAHTVMPRPSCRRLPEPRLDGLADRRVDLVGRAAAPDDEVVLRIGGGEVEEVLAYALVELQRL